MRIRAGGDRRLRGRRIGRGLSTILSTTSPYRPSAGGDLDARESKPGGGQECGPNSGYGTRRTRRRRLFLPRISGSRTDARSEATTRSRIQPRMLPTGSMTPPTPSLADISTRVRTMGANVGTKDQRFVIGTARRPAGIVSDVRPDRRGPRPPPSQLPPAPRRPPRRRPRGSRRRHSVLRAPGHGECSARRPAHRPPCGS